MSNRTDLKTDFSSGKLVTEVHLADLIDSQLNLSDVNLITQVGYTLTSANITGTSYTVDLSLGNVFYFDITSGSGAFTFDYSNAATGVYYFLFRRAAGLGLRNISCASGKYASAFGSLPSLTAPTSTVDGKDLIMGVYDGSRMIVVQQANMVNN